MLFWKKEGRVKSQKSSLNLFHHTRTEDDTTELMMMAAQKMMKEALMDKRIIDQSIPIFTDLSQSASLTKEQAHPARSK